MQTFFILPSGQGIVSALNMAREKLLLIDAHALIHRAYHAIERDLTSPAGEPTKAVYGFASTLLKVLKEAQPQYVVAAFDVGRSLRAEQFAEYKATRPPLAADLEMQFERCRELCAALGIPVFGVEGYEADDLIGTLARQAEPHNLQTLILTGDLDTLQLVDAQTHVLMFVGRSGEIKVYDPDAVRERFGFSAQQLVDYKALRGDASDNIPGIPGVGDKTATKLLQDFGSIEGIYQHRDELDPKTRDKLAAAETQVRLNKELVTIRRDAPVTLDLDAARFGAFDRARVVELFRQLGFHSLLARLPESSAVPSSPRPRVDGQILPTAYHTVLTEDDLVALAARIRAKGACAIDVEATDVDPLRAQLVGIAIGLGEGEAYYIPVQHDATQMAPSKPLRAREQPMLFEAVPATLPVAARQDAPPFAKPAVDRVIAQLGAVFADPAIEKIAHNASYDWIVLERAGFVLKGLAFDTLIAAHLVEPSSQKLGLKELAFAKFGVQMIEIQTLLGKGKGQLSMADVSVDKIAPYACADADYTYRLYEFYRDELKARGLDKLFYDLEMPLVPVIVDLERAGVLLDLALLSQLSQEIATRLSALERQIYDLVGAPFNLGSPQQLSDALFKKLGLPSTGLERTRTGQISTAAGVLEALRDRHPVIGLILEHRELAKLKGTYVDALPQLVNPEDGRVHTDFNQAGTVTGRLSSSNPNLQNIPVRTELGRKVRRAFIAPKGSVLLSADYSQVELRILAHVSQDPNLLKAFAEGEDIHASTAAALFNVPIEQVTPQMRRLGKTINFGVVYGISDWGVAERTELSLEDSRKLIQDYYKKYARVRDYVERTKRMAREKGYVESLLGRRRYFPELASGRHLPPALKNQAEREAINMPIQASAADIIKVAMVRLHREFRERKLRSRMILQVHDELLFEVPEAELEEVAPLVRQVMENAYPLDAPLRVELKVGANWDEMKAL